MGRLGYFGWGASAVAALGVGVMIGWLVWGRAVPELPAAATRQADGSLVLERVASIPVPVAHQLPEGAKPERRVSATVKPATGNPVRLDLSLIDTIDGGRVVASSPDGEVTGGTDLSLRTTHVAFVNAKPWAAGISYAGQRGYGVFVHRDHWRIRMGLEVNALADGVAEARALLGWTW